jgi:hypothetical protein
MDTNLLNIKFARMGARLKIADRPARRNRTAGVVTLDVQADRKGEFFEIVRQPGAEAEIAVLDVQPADRHLLLLVREGKDKSKFLCGHDERHWFLAGIPEAAPVGTVRKPDDPERTDGGLAAGKPHQSRRRHWSAASETGRDVRSGLAGLQELRPPEERDQIRAPLSGRRGAIGDWRIKRRV